MHIGNVFVGTSGFSYKDWEGNFYPEKVASRDYLEYYAGQFQTVEIDSTFYRIPAPSTVDRWRRVTPDTFMLAAKFPRTVTHEGDLPSRLADAERFIEVMRRMEGRLGPLLLQFPYGFRPDQFDVLEKLVDAMPDDLKVSVELRNRKWLGPKLYALLRQKDIALCLIDHPWMPRLSEATADFHYLRFLGDRKKIQSDFSFERDPRESDLEFWQKIIEAAAQRGMDIFAYFNNHYTGHSPTSARRLLELLSGR